MPHHRAQAEAADTGVKQFHRADICATTCIRPSALSDQITYHRGAVAIANSHAIKPRKRGHA